MRLDDYIDGELLAYHLEHGMVSEKLHPFEPLAILNYTKQCQYENAWDDVTRRTRGLIYHLDTYEIVCRPWEKFHNYGEHDTEGWDPEEEVYVTDKMDGSLGILYPLQHGGWAIATRGSFTSEQAVWATEFLRNNYGGWMPVGEFTFLFEIIYPANRVVVDYGDREDLVLLGAVHNESGQSQNPAFMGFPGPRVPNFGYMTLRQALELETRPNAEGVVLHFQRRDSDLFVKVKQDDYVALHRIITGLSERRVWERMAVLSNKDRIHETEHWATYLGIDPKDVPEIQMTADSWRTNVPEEFSEWIDEVSKKIWDDVARISAEAIQLAGDAMKIESRKEQYELVKNHPCATAIMRFVNGNDDSDPTEIILRAWREAKPEATVARFDRTEDVA